MATLIVNNIRLENVSHVDWNTEPVQTTTDSSGFQISTAVECYIAATVHIPANVSMADLTGTSNDVRLEFGGGRAIVGYCMAFTGRGAVHGETARLNYTGAEVIEE